MRDRINETNKIFIINTHSALNTGDSAITLAEILFLRGINDRVNISITSRTPEIDFNYYQKHSIKVFPPVLPSPSVIDGRIKKISYILKNLSQIITRKKLICEIKNSDLIISGGGGYFYSYSKFFPGPMFFQNILHVCIANFFKKPVIFFPQSFGPVRSILGRKILKAALERDNIIKIYTREEISLKTLSSLLNKKFHEKIESCSDMSFYLNPECKKELLNTEFLNKSSIKRKISTGTNYPESPLLIMTLRKWFNRRENEKKYFDSLRDFISLFLKKYGGKVVFYPQALGPGIFEDDRVITRDFLKYLELAGRHPCEVGTLDIEEIKNNKNNIIYLDLNKPLDPFKVIRFISHFDAMVATRFHSAIFSLLAGVPVISISYQFKSRGIMKILGLDQFEVGIPELSCLKILNLFEKILHNRNEIEDKIKKNICLAGKNILNTINFNS